MHSNLAQASQLARKLWDREYQELKIIPSTTRRSPSKAVLLYAEILDYSRFRTVLDCGCGNGRNAIYLASKGCNVHCIDFAPAALEILRQRVEGTELQDRIKIYERSLLERFPFPNDHFDFVLDSYTFCHFLGDERLPYLREISRVVRTSGLAAKRLRAICDAS